MANHSRFDDKQASGQTELDLFFHNFQANGVEDFEPAQLTARQAAIFFIQNFCRCRTRRIIAHILFHYDE